ncbi:acylphosphatase [Sphingobacterium sp. UT-1RO-CII-1]|uniref:acylphosphatase n=1 Tax=Sphingobacterium sp. UT-1RO-CII-1 TaxID=2995225 RepID=UPI00227B52FC|nr:acylphosphatase [Sphingobacterium sp. UT-1RO-CII-1]MCY4781020.1 acylphosphatase [Sphingobacterium sp. UT-1RO-CII-1]
MKHLNIRVLGVVQGVYYRVTTKAVADQLGVKGIVSNLADGSVYIEAEGDAFSLESFLEFCNEGPDRAEVKEVSVEEGDFKGYRNFEIVKKVK